MGINPYINSVHEVGMKNEKFLRCLEKSVRQINWRYILEIVACIATIVCGIVALLTYYRL